MTERKHIVMIAPYAVFPPDEGGRVRAYNILKHLAARYDVTLLSPPLRGALVDLPITVHECIPAGRRHQLFSLRFIRRARAILRGRGILRARKPDVIISEYIWHGVHAAILARLLGCRFVLDSPNVESTRFRSTGSHWWRAVAAWEWLTMRLASRVFVVTNEDRDGLIARGVRAPKIEVIPNGVDSSVMRPDPAAGERTRAALGAGAELDTRAELGAGAGTKLLLFFGQLTYAPNREALAVIHERLLPLLERSGASFEVVVIGKGDAPTLRRRFPHRRLRFLGLVDDLAPYINAADTVIVPVTSGGGSRLKIIESIACGTPVVSTSIGAQGIDPAICGGLLRVTDDWEAFADLALDAGGASREPPRSFLDEYEWHNIVSRLQF